MMNDPAKNMAMERPRDDLVGRRVLLIEDESLVTMLLEDSLAELGCEVAGLASRFHDAAHKAKSLSFDVAILDVDLNGAASAAASRQKSTDCCR